METNFTVLAWKMPRTEELIYGLDYSPWDCKESNTTKHRQRQFTLILANCLRYAEVFRVIKGLVGFRLSWKHTSAPVKTTLVKQGQLCFVFLKAFDGCLNDIEELTYPATFIGKFYFSSFSLGEKASSKIPIRLSISAIINFLLLLLSC